MSESDSRMNALDARLRRMISGLDTRDGFEARLRARIAASPGPEDLRVQLEAGRRAVRRRLRREAWANGITVAGAGVGIAAVVVRFAPQIAQFAGDTMTAAGPVVITGATLAVLALGLWPLLRALPGLRFG